MCLLKDQKVSLSLLSLQAPFKQKKKRGVISRLLLFVFSCSILSKVIVNKPESISTQSDLSLVFQTSIQHHCPCNWTKYKRNVLTQLQTQDITQL